MPEEKDVHPHSPGVGNGLVVAAFDVPAVSVGEEDGPSLQGDLLLEGDGGEPAVAVAGDHAKGQLGVVLRHLFRVADHVPQVDDLLGLVVFDGGVHTR